MLPSIKFTGMAMLLVSGEVHFLLFAFRIMFQFLDSYKHVKLGTHHEPSGWRLSSNTTTIYAEVYGKWASIMGFWLF